MPTMFTDALLSPFEKIELTRLCAASFGLPAAAIVRGWIFAMSVESNATTDDGDRRYFLTVRNHFDKTPPCAWSLLGECLTYIGAPSEPTASIGRLAWTWVAWANNRR